MKLLHAFAGVCFSFAALVPGSISAATFTLTTQTHGSGSVARNPTNAVYPGGAVVTLTALPAEGWSFDSWNGDVAGTNNPINVTMDANKVVTANFLQRTLTVSVSGQGFVSPSGGSYSNGAVVQLTATPSNGWIFHHWDGDAGGSANPLSLTMSADKAVTATFVQPLQIGAHPVGSNVNAGESATFSVTATGTGPIGYQWRFNESALPGETGSFLNLSNVQSSQAGGYRVVVSSPYGMLTSQVATLTVACLGTNTVLVCSEAELRQAIGRGGHVRFCCNGTITLANTITIDRDVTLDGTGMSTAISGGNAVRLFNVNTGVFFTVSNLLLADGLHLGTNGASAVGTTPARDGEPAAGGAIYNSGGTVRLVSCTLSNNHARGGNGGSGNSQATANGKGGDATGGGIYNSAGIIFLQNSRALNNTAQGGTGGTFLIPFPQPGGAYGAGGRGAGGAIYNDSSSLYADLATLEGNQCLTLPGLLGATNIAQGGAVYHKSGFVSFSNALFLSNGSVGNAAQGAGTTPFNSPSSGEAGAFYIEGGSGIFTRVQFISNSAAGGGSFRYSGTSFANGGALLNHGIVAFADCTFSFNYAAAGSGGSAAQTGLGGGLYNVGVATLTAATLDNNIAVGGSGGGWGSPLGWPGAAGLGGGLFNGGEMTGTNLTLSSNRAQGGAAASGGTPAGSAFGGGIFNTRTLELINVTIASNSVVAGFGFQPVAAGANIASTNGTLSLKNSLLAGPTGSNAWGNISDAGFNISSDGSATFSSGSSFNFTDPKLLALVDNGGLTRTMALAPDSPAIDFGTSVGAPSIDQRGIPRPFGAGVDMGAYELGPGLPTLTARRLGAMVSVSFQAEAGVSYRLLRSSDLIVWETEEIISAQPSNGIILRNYPLFQPVRFYRLMLDI